MTHPPSLAPPSRTEPDQGTVHQTAKILAGQWRLVRLCYRQAGRLLGMRAAKAASFSLFVGFAAAVSVASASGSGDPRSVIVLGAKCLTWVVGGVVCFTAARNLRIFYEGSGVRDLICLRGYGEEDLLRAHALATALSVARGIGLPTLGLGLFGLVLVDASRDLLVYPLLLAGVLSYTAAVSVVAHALIRLVSTVSERHSRSALLLIWFGPELARGVWPSAPSLGGLLEWLSAGLEAMATR